MGDRKKENITEMKGDRSGDMIKEENEFQISIFCK